MSWTWFPENAVARRLGRRGAVLVLVGFAWFGIGVDIWFNDTDRFTNGSSSDNGYLQFMDLRWTAFVWGLCGLASIFVGFFRGSKILTEREVVGFNALLTPPLLWAFTYAWSIIAYTLSNGEFGRASSFVALIVYIIVVTFILVIAGWPEPVTPAILKIPDLDDEETDKR